jgi:hypothetical protein
VAPNLVIPGTLSASDNGPMYSSEYYIILKKSNQLTEQDKIDFANRIGQCIGPEGILNRKPVSQNSGQEGPDDYYGTLNASKQLGNTDIPRKFLKAVFKYFGALNNVNPGQWTTDSFLIRQPQLLAAMVTASFPTWNPLHILMRLLFLPCFFVAAITLLFSCKGIPINQADPRRLSWHLLQTVADRSLMCKLASMVWYNRLKNDYDTAEMNGVAANYYQTGHPFIKYWIS